MVAFVNLVASLLAIAGVVWGVVAAPNQTIPFWLLAISVASTFAISVYDPRSATLKFRVRQVCSRIKARAETTLSIAAGDCSWIVHERQQLLQIAETVRVRLLCIKNLTDPVREVLSELARHNNITIHTYETYKEMPFRFIIADGEKQQGRSMIYVDKRVPVFDLMGFFSIPDPLRTTHKARYIDPNSREFSMISRVFDLSFRAGPLFQP
ncbi:MAG: hypothetical protein ACYTG0_04255 [Planctomycetota bacterium]|jgi:hypothetical protein